MIELRDGWRCSAIKRYSVKFSPEPLRPSDANPPSDPGTALTKLVYDEMRKHANAISFQAAMQIVTSIDAGAALLKSYNASAKSDPSVLRTHKQYAQAEAADTERLADQADTVAEEVDTLAHRVMNNFGESMSYGKAVAHVLNGNPALAKRYTEATNPNRQRRR